MLLTEDISISFGGLKAVEKVSLEVREGEILSLIGPNGAGKTTFFNLVSGFLKPSCGTVRFTGTDITGMSPHEIAKKGLVRTFQKTNIFAGVSVAESVKIGFHLHRDAGLLDILTHRRQSRQEDAEVLERAEELLSFTSLAPWKRHLVKNIPYGKQRMLGIALALAAAPKLLLLDEPATGLNTVETQELMELILKIRAEKKNNGLPDRAQHESCCLHIGPSGGALQRREIDGRDAGGGLQGPAGDRGLSGQGVQSCHILKLRA